MMDIVIRGIAVAPGKAGAGTQACRCILRSVGVDNIKATYSFCNNIPAALKLLLHIVLLLCKFSPLGVVLLLKLRT